MNVPNGRIDLYTPDTQSLFDMYDRMMPKKKPYDFREATVGFWQPTPLSDAFFSKENQTVVQNGLRRGVYDRSGGKIVIDEQNYDELLIIMREVYLSKSRPKTTNLKEHISELNKVVLNYAIPQVFNEVVAYFNYREDISYLPTPIDRPTMISNQKHSKQLNMTSTFL